MKRVALVLAVLVVSSGTGFAQSEVGNVCVQDYQPGAGCTANDVRFEEFTFNAVLEDCTQGTPGEAEATFDVTVGAYNSPDRYDIGFFMARDGGSALSGDDCFHSYLWGEQTATPNYTDTNGNGVFEIVDGPWWNGGTDLDRCGDMEANTEIITTTIPIRFACEDRNQNLLVDISVCASWDNNAGTICSSVVDAFPGTNSKCGCQILDLDIDVPVELESFSIE